MSGGRCFTLGSGPDGIETCTHLALSIDNFAVNEGNPTTCWMPYQYLHVRDFAIAGEVHYSDTFLPVPGVTVSTVDVCGGEVSSART